VNEATPLPPAGWYPDPADETRQRYWNGTQWTMETRIGTPDFAAPGVAYTKSGATEYPTQPEVPYQAEYPPHVENPYQPTGIVPGYGAYNPNSGYEHPLYGSAYRGPRTADGVPLAGWWWRVLALLLDNIILNVVAMIYAPLLPDYTTGLTRWFEDYLRAVGQGSLNLPDIFDSQYYFIEPLLAYGAVSTIVAIIYATCMLAFKGATLGMLACQMRVVPTGHGQNATALPMGKAALRCVMYQVLSFIPLLGFINTLFPLWDKGRQTLHDKIAGTQVVRLA
jgi:uncharacterized RDD family membrane protein YckC